MKKKFLNKYDNFITPTCLVILFCAVILYMYFLSLSVMHVVMRKEALNNLNELQAKIAKLESSYIEAQYQISSKVSTIEGFSETSNKIFVNLSDDSLVLNTEVR